MVHPPSFECRDRRRRPIALTVAVLALSLGLIGSEARAVGSGSAFTVLCEGAAACDGLGTPLGPGLTPGATTPGGNALDFLLALRIDAEGLDLRIASGGDVYLLGDLVASGSILLDAERIDSIGNTRIQADRIELWSGGLVPSEKDPDLLVRPGSPRAPRLTVPTDITLTAGPLDAPLICACVSTLPGLPGGSISVRGGNLRLQAATGIAALTGVEATDGSPPGLWFERDGDVFVDLSGVSLADLKIQAAGHVVIAGGRSTPVPEPGPALLLALGLCGLAAGGSRGSLRR